MGGGESSEPEWSAPNPTPETSLGVVSFTVLEESVVCLKMHSTETPPFCFRKNMSLMAVIWAR